MAFTSKYHEFVQKAVELGEPKYLQATQQEVGCSLWQVFHGFWLDLIILEVFSDLAGSVILY